MLFLFLVSWDDCLCESNLSIWVFPFFLMLLVTNVCQKNTAFQMILAGKRHEQIDSLVCMHLKEKEASVQASLSQSARVFSVAFQELCHIFTCLYDKKYNLPNRKMSKEVKYYILWHDSKIPRVVRRKPEDMNQDEGQRQETRMRCGDEKSHARNITCRYKWHG